jgi:hypothetical protein
MIMPQSANIHVAPTFEDTLGVQEASLHSRLTGRGGKTFASLAATAVLLSGCSSNPDASERRVEVAAGVGSEANGSGSEYGSDGPTTTVPGATTMGHLVAEALRPANSTTTTLSNEAARSTDRLVIRGQEVRLATPEMTAQEVLQVFAENFTAALRYKNPKYTAFDARLQAMEAMDLLGPQLSGAARANGHYDEILEILIKSHNDQFNDPLHRPTVRYEFVSGALNPATGDAVVSYDSRESARGDSGFRKASSLKLLPVLVNGQPVYVSGQPVVSWQLVHTKVQGPASK